VKVLTRPNFGVAPLWGPALTSTRYSEWFQRHQYCHRAANGRVKPGRDGAWVSREQLRLSQDPPTHPRGGPIKTYNSCPQPFASSARSLVRIPDARAMPPGKKTGAAPLWMEGQVHLSGNTQYVTSCALGRIGEGDDQPAKNREMRSLTQKGNQTKFFHRMPGIQRSPAVYNFQHLREYKSC